MGLYANKDSDNFYPKIIEGTEWHCDYLWSTHRGCPYDCIYCSSKRLNKRFGGDACEIRRLKGEWVDIGGLLEPIRLTRLLPTAGVFVNPYCDIMALPQYDVGMIFTHCNDEMTRKQDSKLHFIFQSRNTWKYFDYLAMMPEGSWLGTTIETDEDQLYNYLNISKAPHLIGRKIGMEKISTELSQGRFKIFLTLEPIMKFSLKMFTWWIDEIEPDLVFIGAATGRNNLPEPTNDELIKLIYALYDSIGIDKVYLKSNVRRLIPAFYDGWKLAEEQNKSVKNLSLESKM